MQKLEKAEIQKIDSSILSWIIKKKNHNFLQTIPEFFLGMCK